MSRPVRLMLESRPPERAGRLDLGVHREALHSWVRRAGTGSGSAAVSC